MHSYARTVPGAGTSFFPALLRAIATFHLWVPIFVNHDGPFVVALVFYRCSVIIFIKPGIELGQVVFDGCKIVLFVFTHEVVHFFDGGRGIKSVEMGADFLFVFPRKGSVFDSSNVDADNDGENCELWAPHPGPTPLSDRTCRSPQSRRW